MSDRTLDYIPRLDERNRAHRVSADMLNLHKSRYWTPGYPVLDQGREGACVGFGATGEAMASPVRKKFINNPNDTAIGAYRRAQQIDAWEGEQYEGTSVLAGMKVGREWGWWTGYRWALNMRELRAALEEGPVVIGVEWRAGMYEAMRGQLLVTGPVVGGHCILVTGYSERTKSYRLRNSWGVGWGYNGSAYITDTDLNRILFQAGGEAAIPVGRKA